MSRPSTRTPDVVQEVHRLRASGLAWGAIAKQMGVSEKTPRCWVDEEYRQKLRGQERIKKTEYRKLDAEYQAPTPKPEPPPTPPGRLLSNEAEVIRLRRKRVPLTAIATLTGLRYREVIAIVDAQEVRT